MMRNSVFALGDIIRNSFSYVLVFLCKIQGKVLYVVPQCKRKCAHIAKKLENHMKSIKINVFSKIPKKGNILIL